MMVDMVCIVSETDADVIAPLFTKRLAPVTVVKGDTTKLCAAVTGLFSSLTLTAACHAQGGPENLAHFVRRKFIIILTDIRNCFTVRIRRKFAILPSLTRALPERFRDDLC